MTTKQNGTQAFGTWPSPISAAVVSSSTVGLGGLAAIGDSVFWAETRPNDNNRCVVVKKRLSTNTDESTAQSDCFGHDYTTRTRVHEYGGASWWVDDSYVYFVHWTDQCLYRVLHENLDDSASDSLPAPERITTEGESKQAIRFADGCVANDSRWIVCVRESHQQSNDKNRVVNEIVAIENKPVLNNTVENIVVLASGADFYACPRLSPCGSRLSWIQWQHPQMPWDGTELRAARIDERMHVSRVQRVAGSSTESIMSACWLSNGQLAFASDRSGWWNVYAAHMEQQSSLKITEQQLTFFSDREVGIPAWALGTQRFVELSAGQSNGAQSQSFPSLALLVTHEAKDQLYVLDGEGRSELIDWPYVAANSIVATHTGDLLVNVQTDIANRSIVRASMTQLPGQSCFSDVIQPVAIDFDTKWLSSPSSIRFESNGGIAHAFFYPPADCGISTSADELPPLVVMSHGGPTSHATAALKLSIQFWTSRGFAVADVNYRGSSGFGRDYRRLLDGQWGIVDVEDCVAAAEMLAKRGLVDKNRMLIRGGSAGGLTVLRALQVTDSFAAGTSLYGVSDLQSLAGDTHKFESRYLDGLIGGTYEDQKHLYDARSPINHTDALTTPLLVLQGEDDKVVPPSQSESIVKAVAEKGLPHAYILFPDEQHGFRQTDNIIRALEVELWFYGKVLGFAPADSIAAPKEAAGFT